MQIRKEKKMKLTNEELKCIKGGAGLSGTLINSLINGIKTFMDVGRYFGSSIRRLFGGKFCSM